MRYYTSDNIRKFKAVYNVVVGKRSHGKSFDMALHAVTQYWDAAQEGRCAQWAYLRRLDEDIKGASAASVCDCLVCDGNGVDRIAEITGGAWDGVTYYRRGWYLTKRQNDGKVIKDNQPFMIAFALSRYMHDKGGQFPYVTDIWFDEFIEVAERSYIVNEFKLFQNVISTIARKRHVTIWMCGNTMDFKCPYFSKMGITNIRSQKPGTIQIYRLGQTDKLIAVEMTPSTPDYKKVDINNDYLFAFNDPELKMITTGEWEISAHSMAPAFDKRLVAGRFFIQYAGDTLVAYLMSRDDGGFYIYVTRELDPLDPQTDDDLFYSDVPRWTMGYRSSPFKPMTPNERIIAQWISTSRVFFDDNETGFVWDHWLRHVRKQV